MTRTEKVFLAILSALLAATLAADLLGPSCSDERPEPLEVAAYYAQDSLEALNWTRLTFLDSLSRGRLDTVIVPYRKYFVECADSIGWDWHMLAALSFHESKFDLNAVSRKGAVGLMQVTPPTAGHYGIYDLHDPRQNIRRGPQHQEYGLALPSDCRRRE